MRTDYICVYDPKKLANSIGHNIKKETKAKLNY